MASTAPTNAIRTQKACSKCIRHKCPTKIRVSERLKITLPNTIVLIDRCSSSIFRFCACGLVGSVTRWTGIERSGQFIEFVQSTTGTARCLDDSIENLAATFWRLFGNRSTTRGDVLHTRGLTNLSPVTSHHVHGNSQLPNSFIDSCCFSNNFSPRSSCSAVKFTCICHNGTRPSSASWMPYRPIQVTQRLFVHLVKHTTFSASHDWPRKWWEMRPKSIQTVQIYGSVSVKWWKHLAITAHQPTAWQLHFNWNHHVQYCPSHRSHWHSNKNWVNKTDQTFKNLNVVACDGSESMG